MKHWSTIILASMLMIVVAGCGAPLGAENAKAAPPLAPELGPPPTAAAVIPEAEGAEGQAVFGADSPIAPPTCPVTRRPSQPFTPPAPYPAQAPYKGQFWYGTPQLWTMLHDDGVWRQLPQSTGEHGTKSFGQKTVWWRVGYDYRTEQNPNLIVTGRRLDAEAPPLKAWAATNAYHDDIKSFMLVGIEIPSEGCWEITGTREKESLQFVVWVTPG